MRKKIVAGNWKMNKTYQEGLQLMKEVIELYKMKGNAEVEVILCPPYIHANICSALTETVDGVFAGAQNAADHLSGAYTGETSPEMLKSIGLEYVILGHSERRMYYHEDNSLLKMKVALAIETGLKPIYCIGETLEERENGKLFEVIKQQLQSVLADLSVEQMANVVLAYEPVWAIGTGKTASPDQAQEMHAFVRTVIREMHGDELADAVSILYGGSCKPSNAKEIFVKEDVDGGLIGGASLVAEDFIQIVNAF